MSLQSVIMSGNPKSVGRILKMMKNDDQEALLKNINMIDSATGDTPLTSALRVGSWSIICLLMRYGADPMIPNKRGEFPAQINSPVRGQFIQNFLSQSSENPNIEPLLAVSASAIHSALFPESLTKLTEKLDIINNIQNDLITSLPNEANNNCMICKNDPCYYHIPCQHLVFCEKCYSKLKREQKICPFCKNEFTEKEMIKTEYVKLDNI